VRGKVVATISKQPIRTPTPNHQVVIPTTLKLISTSSAGDAIVPWPADNPIPSFTSADAVTPLLPKDFIGSPESNDDIVASASADGVVAPRSEDGRLHTEAQQSCLGPTGSDQRRKDQTRDAEEGESSAGRGLQSCRRVS
jgi:hypothetical protein